MKLISTLSSLFAAALLISPVSAAETASLKNTNRPNILIIMVDDLEFSDIGCCGSEIETPTPVPPQPSLPD